MKPSAARRRSIAPGLSTGELSGFGGNAVKRKLLVCALFVGVLSLTGAPALRAQEETMAISLHEALGIALDNNLDLVSAKMDPAISGEQIGVQDGGFDPVFTSAVGASAFKTKPFLGTTTFTVPGRGRGYFWNNSIFQPFKIGGSLDVELRTNRRTGAGTNFGVIDGTSWDSTLDMEFNMPLLRGRGTVATAEALLLARGDLEISREELRRQAEVTLEQVEGAYWDVVAARAAVNVAEERLQRAMDLLELNRKKVEVGTLAPIEITQAEAGVASNEEGVILAEETLGNSEDELRRLLAIPSGDPRWNQTIIPTDAPQFNPLDVDLDAAIEEALAYRPEMANAQQDVDNRTLSERAAKNNAKHGLDFRLQTLPVGNNLNLNDFPPLSAAEGNINDALSETFRFDFYSWNSQLVYAIPIGNQAAKSNYRIATWNRRKAEVGLDNQAQTIRVEVRRAARAVDAGIKRVDAARTNVRLQKEKLDAEEKKFENGMSTSFEVLTFQDDLADAELSQIRAALDYLKAIAGLERVKGTIMSARGFSLDR